jgi:hypothetical protein
LGNDAGDPHLQALSRRYGLGGTDVGRWVGAEGWLCDAMATAVMVGGQDSAKWFSQPELKGYQVFAVNRHEQSAWSI